MSYINERWNRARQLKIAIKLFLLLCLLRVVLAPRVSFRTTSEPLAAPQCTIRSDDYDYMRERILHWNATTITRGAEGREGQPAKRVEVERKHL